MADSAQQPYDPGEELVPPDKAAPQTQPYLKAVPGTGKSDGIHKGNLSSVPSDKSDAPEGLAQQEKGASRRTSAGNELTALEGGAGAAASSLYNGASATGAAGKVSGVKNFFWGSRRRKQASVGTGITGLLLGGGVFGLIVASGPAQLIQLGEVLKGDFSLSESQSSTRLGSLFRNARANATGDVGETRVGILGSKIFGNSIAQLKNLGIEFQRAQLTGVPISATIDTTNAELLQEFPELNGMSQDEQVAWIANKFSVPEKLISFSDGKYIIDISDSNFGLTATRALTRSSLDLLDDGSLVTAIRARVMDKFYNTPSLFHPIRRALASPENKAATQVQLDQAEATRVEDDITTPAAEATGLPEVDATLASKLNGLSGKIGTVLLVTSAMCLVRSVSGDVVNYNRDAIVVPAALEATDLIAVSDQIKTGQDITAQQVGAVVNGFTNSQGQTIWQGQALQVTEGVSSPSGPDLPGDYQQAFSNDTTAQNINDYVGGGTFGGIACTPAGQIVQSLAGVALLVSGFVDGTASWQLFAVSKSAEVVATGGALYMIEHQLTNILKDKAVVPSVLSGPLGGNIAAYGAREAAGIGSRAAGGVALASSTTSKFLADQQTKSAQQFHSESFFARVFDIDDYRSLAGKVADSFSPSFSVDMANVVGSFSHIGSFIPHMLASIIPGGHAQAASTYNWGFPEYGIPSSVMNDPDMADPYTNAGDVAALLNTAQGAPYIAKATTCFGVSIASTGGVWDVTPTTAVNPNSDDYVNANCSDTSDLNWDRVMMFVFDTNTMESAACYAGDAQSCTNVGF
jgi:hypothetical protein